MAANAPATDVLTTSGSASNGLIHDDRAAARGAVWLGLVVVLLVALLFRVVALDRVPPGLNQDETANAWSAYCLLKTGRTAFGEPWPLFYYRGLGANRSALFLYFILPFQALGGLNVWTMRLPAALAGVATVWLLYWVAARLFGRPTGLIAAGLLAINPLHIEMTRWGHEASIIPLLICLPIAALLWAGLPLAQRMTTRSSGSQDDEVEPRPVRALVAGAVTGLCCYGYPAVRLMLPVWFLFAVLVNLRQWARLVRQHWRAALLFGIGVGMTFGPLLYMHVTQPEHINRRGAMTWLWLPEDPVPRRVEMVIDRYLAHFHPHFLFEQGDADGIAWTPGFGFVPQYYLPLWLLGLIVLLPRVKFSSAARFVLVGTLLYPAADAISWHISLHAFRSSAGLIALLLLAAAGLSPILLFLLRRRMRTTLLALVAALIGTAAPGQIRFANSYFLDRGMQQEVYDGNAVDLVTACRWLRPRLEQYDAVIFTTLGFNQPYLATLMVFEHEPRQWFDEPRRWFNDGWWDVYRRYGKVYFLPPEERAALLREMAADDQPQRVALVLDAVEAAPGQPVQVIIGPADRPELVIYELEL